MSALRTAMLPSPLPKPAWHDTASNLERTLEWIHAHLTTDTLMVPAKDELRPLIRKLRDLFRAKTGLSNLTRKEQRLAPWAILDKYIDERCLMDIPGFASWYFRETATLLKERPFLSHIQAYLLHVNEAHIWVADYTTFIQSHLADFDKPRVVGWQDKHRNFGLFDLDGPGQLATQFMDSNETSTTFLIARGLVNELEQHGYIERTDNFLITECQARLANSSLSLEKLTQLLHLFETQDRPRSAAILRLRGTKKLALTNSLLLPFSNKQPEKQLKGLIKSWLLAQLDDPRLKPASWAGVNPAAVEVIKAWLVEETLDTFFRIIDKVASRYTGADTQWIYRSNYWKRYLRAGFITEAWIALGPSIQHDASSLLHSSQVQFGHLHTGDGAQSQHATLIMQVGGVIVTEWSHNAKCRVWTEHLSSAPAFYKKHYRRQELVTNADHEQIHHGASNFTWQSQLDRYLHSHAGIRI